MFARICAIAVLSMLLSAPMAAQSAEADEALVDQGRYLAIAGDCAACHGINYSGGAPIPSPIGNIYASNITPDRETGIGTWAIGDFASALRKGIGSKGHLYPAMPYTSYTGLSDHDIQALWSYFSLSVDPVANQPPDTDLPFPFLRPLMTFWNALFLDEGVATGADVVEGETLSRGRFLVETLGHCSDCHTRRGNMMQQLSDHHLAGAEVGGWWAPNITPHETGIGSWSDEKLTTFLTTGHTKDAVAAGEMATVVSRSLSKLSEDDIAAMVAYLRAVPAIASKQPPREKTGKDDLVQLALSNGETGRWQNLINHDTIRGDALYQSACASCHGIDGRGSINLAHPSLRQVSSVTGPMPNNLVQVIVHGVDRAVDNRHVFMPGFRSAMSDAQIAAVANYVRTSFGGVISDLDAEQINTVLSGKHEASWLIVNAKWLAIVGIILAVVVLVLTIWVVLRLITRKKRVLTR